MSAPTTTIPVTILVAAAFLTTSLPGTSSAQRRPLHVLMGSDEGGRFGWSLARAGDLDGDGASELLVGAPMERVAGERRGVVRVYSGRDGSLRFHLEGDDAFDRFGYAVAGGEDLDGDGVPDLVIGAPTGEPAAGCVQARSGRSGAVLWTAGGSEPGERFGHSLDLLGDLDGDGRAEVVVGAPYADAAGTNAGRVVVLSGADGSRLRERHGAAWDQLGSSVCALGDLDGDGLAELACGVPFADPGAFNAGAALVLSGADGAILFEVHGQGAGDRLGSRVGAAGDVDGDGVPDLLVGIPGADLAGIDSGGARVCSGVDGAELLTIAGQGPGELLEACRGVGDLDGDGRADLAVGAPGADGHHPQAGRVRVVSGASGSTLLTLEGRSPDDWLGATLRGVGDLDGDGCPDFAAGAPGHDDVPSERGHVVVHSGRGGS